MRSNIFKESANLTKDFREDFEVFWKLPAKQRKALIPHVSIISKARTTGDQQEALENAVTKIDGNSADVLRAIKILLFFYQNWNPIRDTPEAFFKDIGELNLVPSNKAEEAKIFFLDFLEEVEKQNSYRLEKIFASALLPKYLSCDTLIDYRAIIRNPYGFTEEKDIKTYEPRCVGFVPVVIVDIENDATERGSFQFQCEADSLQRLIDILNAALKDLQAAQSSMPEGD